MTAIERLDAAVTDFAQAGERYGIAMPPAEIEQINMLDTIAEAIAPFRVPPDIDHFYRSWSITSAAGWFGPELCDLSFALDSWRMHQEDQPPWPSTVLFPIAYTSHWYHMVELDHPGSLGPFIYDCAYAGGRFTLAHSCLAAWIEWATIELDAGRVVRYPGTFATLEVEGPSEDTVPTRIELLRRDGVPESELDHFDDGDRSLWPLRWNLADGYDPADYELRGATGTVQDFVDALREGAATATLHVVFARQSGPDVEIADDTGFLVVRLPARGQPFGSGRVWEIDVTGEQQPDLQVLKTQDIDELPPWSEEIENDPDQIASYARSIARRSMVPGPPVAHVIICRPIDLTESAPPNASQPAG
ncbi:MAG TPA: hypothetical protein VES40_01085 [Ilumatobacteraceae bacterium]|nr:hypothetical protein [Ilumatobacteraceae bacterium]